MRAFLSTVMTNVASMQDQLYSPLVERVEECLQEAIRYYW
jgi:hypothetical protein